jgi:hypothetical protein
MIAGCCAMNTNDISAVPRDFRSMPTRSTSFRRRDELAIIVTPNLVRRSDSQRRQPVIALTDAQQVWKARTSGVRLACDAGPGPNAAAGTAAAPGFAVTRRLRKQPRPVNPLIAVAAALTAASTHDSPIVVWIGRAGRHPVRLHWTCRTRRLLPRRKRLAWTHGSDRCSLVSGTWPSMVLCRTARNMSPGCWSVRLRSRERRRP